MVDLVNLEGIPLCMDWRELCRELPDDCINLLFLDPPYNNGKFCKMAPSDYINWCSEWIMEGLRVLAPNGAFWISHSDPVILGRLSEMIAKYGCNLINWITWDKYNGNPTVQACNGPMVGMTMIGNLRSFQPMVEYLIWHNSDSHFGNKIRDARVAAGLTTIELGEHFKTHPDRVNHGGCITNWEIGYNFPTTEQFCKLADILDIECSRDDLYAEYMSRRYTFNNPGKMSSVWQIAPSLRNGHPTPKPEELLSRIILATSNEGDLILDFFAGSFTTAVVAQRLGRRWICTDIKQEYVNIGIRRLSTLYQVEMCADVVRT